MGCRACAARISPVYGRATLFAFLIVLSLKIGVFCGERRSFVHSPRLFHGAKSVDENAQLFWSCNRHVQPAGHLRVHT